MATYGQYADDYEYNPETEQVIIVDGFGGYVMPKGLSEQEISQNVEQIGYSEETTYDDLKHNSKFLDTYKRMYQKAEGEDFKGTDQELVDNYMTEFTYINTNSYDFGKTIYNAYQDEDEQSKQDLGYLLDLYDRTSAFGEGSRSFFSQVRDVGWGLLTDPLILGTLGTGIVYKTALQKVATEGIKAGIKRSVAGKVAATTAKHPMKTIGATGGVGGLSWNTAYQDLKLETGITQKKAELGVLKDIAGRTVEEEDVGIDPLEVGIVTAASAGGGMAIGKLGSLAIQKIARLRKVDPAKYDNMSRAELDAEVDRRGIKDPIASRDKEIDEIDISNKNKGDAIPWVNSDGTKINVVLGNTLSKLDAKADYLKEQSIIDHIEGNQARQGTITKRSENEIEITFDDQTTKVIKNPEEALLAGELLPPMKRTIYDWDSLGPNKDTKLNELNELITNKLKEQELLLDVTPVTNQRRQQKVIADIERTFARKNEVDPLEKAEDIPQINLLDKDGNIIERVNISARNTISKKYEDILPDDILRQRLVEYDTMERNINKYMTNLGGWAAEKIKRSMTSHYGLPVEAKNRMERSIQNLTGQTVRANGLIQNLERVWQLGSGTKLDNAPQDVHKALRQALIDDRIFDDLALSSTNKYGAILLKEFKNGDTQALKSIITEMRENITNISQELLNSGAIQKNSPLYKTIQESIRDKNYVHQQYLFHEFNQNLSLEELAAKIFDSKKISIEKGVEVNPLTYMINKIKEDHGLESDDEARLILNLIATQSDTTVQRYGQFLKKNLDDEVIKEILGDVTDPRAVYYNTLLKTHKFVEDFKLKKDIAQIAIKKGRAFQKAQRRGVPQIVSDWKPLDSEKDFSLSLQDLDEVMKTRFETSFTNPVQSLLVDPFFKKAYDNARGIYHRTADTSLLKVVHGMTNLFQINKILLSPTTHARALGGGLLNNLGNGVIPVPSSEWKKWVKDTPTSPSIFKKLVPLSGRMKIGDRLTKDDYEALARLTELGLRHGGARSGLIRSTRQFWAGSTPIDSLERKLFVQPKGVVEKSSKFTEKRVDELSNIYSSWDDWNRIKAFEYEFLFLDKDFGAGTNTDDLLKLARQVKVPNPEQVLTTGTRGLTNLIEEVAAAKVTKYSPSYNKLPLISQELRNWFIGNFISHPLEMIRNYKEGINLARIELTSSSKLQRARGLFRAGGLTAYSFMTLGTPASVTYAIFGINPREQKALNSEHMNSPFDYGFQKILGSSIKEGKYITANTGYLDGLSVLGRPSRIFLDKLMEFETLSTYDPEFDSQLTEASKKSAEIFFSQYLSPAAAPEALTQFYEIVGSSLAGETIPESTMRKFYQSIPTLFEPSFLNDLQRAANQSGYPFYPLIDEATGKLRTGRKVEHPLLPLISWTIGLRPKEESVFENIGYGISNQHRDFQKTRTAYNDLFKQDSGIIIEGRRLTEEQKNTVRQTMMDMYEGQHKVSKELHDAYGVYNSIASEKNFGKKKFKDKDKIFKNLMTSNLLSGPDTQTGSATYKGTFKKEYADHIMNGESVLSVPVIFTNAGEARRILLREVAGNSFIETLRKDFNRLYVKSLKGEEE